GAVVGCLLAGFYLLRVYDLGTATYSAAAMNFGATAIAWFLASRTPQTQAEAPTVAMESRGSKLIYVVTAISGLTALGAEVVWTRLWSLLLAGTLYTCSIILAVFLLGLWGGSGAGTYLARRIESAAWALAGCQLLLAAAIAWTAFTISSVLPYWPVDPWL